MSGCEECCMDAFMWSEGPGWDSHQEIYGQLLYHFHHRGPYNEECSEPACGCPAVVGR